MVEKIKAFFKSLVEKTKKLILKVAYSVWYAPIVGSICFIAGLAESWVGMVTLFIVLGILGYVSNKEMSEKFKKDIEKYNVFKD